MKYKLEISHVKKEVKKSIRTQRQNITNGFRKEHKPCLQETIKKQADVPAQHPALPK